MTPTFAFAEPLQVDLDHNDFGHKAAEAGFAASRNSEHIDCPGD
jgi:hypothetical protein